MPFPLFSRRQSESLDSSTFLSLRTSSTLVCFGRTPLVGLCCHSDFSTLEAGLGATGR